MAVATALLATAPPAAALPYGSLQPDGGAQSLLHSTSTERLAAYFHVPKAGSSFGTAIVHYLDVEGVLPPYVKVADCETEPRACEAPFEAANYTLTEGVGSEKTFAAFTTAHPPFWYSEHRLYGRCGEDSPNWWAVVPNTTEAADASFQCSALEPPSVPLTCDHPAYTRAPSQACPATCVAQSGSSTRR